MIGVSAELNKTDLIEEKLSKLDAGNVVEEMKTFGKECKDFQSSLHSYPL